MKKKLAASVLSAALLVGGATTAFAATDPAKVADIKSLYQQMFGIQKQILQKEVEAGALTQDQANAAQSLMEQRQTWQEQALDNGQVWGPGIGMGRWGYYGSNNGQPLTADQQKALTDMMQERLKLQEEALKNGTLVPGMHGGFGRWGGIAPWGTITQPSTDAGTTN